MKCARGWRRCGAAAALPLLLGLDLAGGAAAQLVYAPAPAVPQSPALGGYPMQKAILAQPKPLPTVADSRHTLMNALPPKGSVTMRSLKLASTVPSQGASIYIGPRSEFAMGMDSAGNFMIEKAAQGGPMLELDTGYVLHLNTKRVQAFSVDVQNGISLRGVRQWELVNLEDISSVGAAGWTRRDVTQCAGVTMLGGYCKFSAGEVNKTFYGLPPHKHLRIKATFHFIDRWIGESGYMKLNIGQDAQPVVVWSEMHAQEQSKNGISLCGQGDTPEGKFAVPIDVTVPHTAESVRVSFGSTMDDSDPCDESWGVSGIEMYTRM